MSSGGNPIAINIISYHIISLPKTGHDPHSSTLVVICAVRSLFVLFYVLFVCKCVLPPGDNPTAVNKYHISYIILYHILSYRVVSYHISYHIISYHILPYRIVSYIISYLIYHIVSYHFTSYRIIPYHIYHIVSYHIISHRIVSYHINKKIRIITLSLDKQASYILPVILRIPPFTCVPKS